MLGSTVLQTAKRTLCLYRPFSHYVFLKIVSISYNSVSLLLSISSVEFPYFYSSFASIYLLYVLCVSCILPPSFPTLFISIFTVRIAVFLWHNVVLVASCLFSVCILLKAMFLSFQKFYKKLLLEEHTQSTTHSDSLLRALMPMLWGVQFHSVIRSVGTFESQTKRFIWGNNPCVCTGCEAGLGSGRSHSQHGNLGEEKNSLALWHIDR